MKKIILGQSHCAAFSSRKHKRTLRSLFFEYFIYIPNCFLDNENNNTVNEIIITINYVCTLARFNVLTCIRAYGENSKETFVDYTSKFNSIRIRFALTCGDGETFSWYIWMFIALFSVYLFLGRGSNGFSFFGIQSGSHCIYRTFTIGCMCVNRKNARGNCTTFSRTRNEQVPKRKIRTETTARRIIFRIQYRAQIHKHVYIYIYIAPG